ncbi:MAG: hypothetical protein WD602_00590 [Actinomycetota bacterium]
MRPRDQISPAIQTSSQADELGRVAELFGLVADKTRAGILYALSESGELAFAHLVAQIDASEKQLTGALRALRVSGMVRSRRHRGTVLYSLRDGDIAELLHVAAISTQEALVGPVRRRSGSRLPARR